MDQGNSTGSASSSGHLSAENAAPLASHTPTPWTLTPLPHASWIGSIGNNSDDPQLWSVATPFPKGDKLADAALIVKAVNAHDELVRALKFYADPARYDGPNLRAIPNDPYAKADSVYIHDVTRDNGRIAREALASLGDETLHGRPY